MDGWERRKEGTSIKGCVDGRDMQKRKRNGRKKSLGQTHRAREFVSHDRLLGCHFGGVDGGAIAPMHSHKDQFVKDPVFGWMIPTHDKNVPDHHSHCFRLPTFPTPAPPGPTPMDNPSPKPTSPTRARGRYFPCRSFHLRST